MFKTTATAWLVRLVITWAGAGIIAFLVADYVLRVNVETVGAGLGGLPEGIARLETEAAAQSGEIAALKAAVEAQTAALEALQRGAGATVPAAPAGSTAPAATAPAPAAPASGEAGTGGDTGTASPDPAASQ